ncbi:MAG: M28 family peptidase [Myxococcales bacterium]|nr:M28 family peptidase [Myxococcales bacterium]
MTSDAGALSSEVMMTWIRDMAALGARRAGSPAGHACESYLADKLASFDLANVRREAMEVEVYVPTQANVSVREGDAWHELAAQWIPHAAFTPEGGLEAPMVWATPSGEARAGQWQGKIVVAEIRFPMLQASLLRKLSLGMHDPDNDVADVNHPATWVRLNWHLYQQAAARGAVGFIGILVDQPGGSHRMYAPYGFKERDILDKPLPGFWVGRDDGARLRQLAGAGATARLVLSGTRGPGVTHNIVGELPGAAADAEAVVIHCHHDSPFESPVEDASGCAVVLAVARALAEAGPLRRRVIVLFTAGHFYGSIGTRTFISRHRDTLLPQIALEITTEHVAKEAVEDASGKLVPNGRTEATGCFVPFQRALADRILGHIKANALQRTLLLPPEGPLGDYPPTDGGDWHEAGIPIINFISNPVYLLTADDALPWVDEPRLPRLAQTVLDIVRDVDTLSKAELGRTDMPMRRLLMRGLMHLARAKTTRLGTRPVY